MIESNTSTYFIKFRFYDVDKKPDLFSSTSIPPENIFSLCIPDIMLKFNHRYFFTISHFLAEHISTRLDFIENSKIYFHSSSNNTSTRQDIYFINVKSDLDNILLLEDKIKNMEKQIMELFYQWNFPDSPIMFGYQKSERDDQFKKEMKVYIDCKMLDYKLGNTNIINNGIKNKI